MTQLDEVKRKAYNGAVIELVGYGTGQALRLVSTLILSRLLFPEAFGLAAIVALFIQGLTLLSDTGVQQSLIQNPKGDSSEFRNTAWFINIFRGFILWVIALLIAWPVSVIYAEPQLMQLLPVGSLVLVVAGFSSTSLISLRRKVRLAPLVLVELSAQLISLVTIVVWASLNPTVWALVAAGLVSSLVTTSASYFLDKGYSHSFEFHKESAMEIFHFGKWIFASSALSFFARQGDRLLSGSLAGMATLGIYSMAVFISDAIGIALARITSGVLYPVLSSVVRENAESLRVVYYHARLRTDFLGLLPIGMLMMMSTTVIEVLYDERYIAAGWMLQLLCLRVAMNIVVESIQNCVFSLGYTHYGFRQNLARTICIFVGIPIAWPIWGFEGLVWVTVLSEAPVLLMVWRTFSKFELLSIRNEVGSVLIFGFGALLGTLLDFLLTPYIAKYL